MLRVDCEIHVHSQAILIQLLKELTLEGFFQWNGAILDTKFLTLLLFSVCSEKVDYLEVTDT